MEWTKVISASDNFATMSDAIRAWAFMQTQVDYIGGRLFIKNKRYHAEAFFPHDGKENGWLPDGVRRVVLPLAMAKRCLV